MMRLLKLSFTYESEFSTFLQQLKSERPELTSQQQAGRALLWDKKPLDPDQVQRQRASHVKRGAYAYR